jgi:hypothetical protein
MGTKPVVIGDRRSEHSPEMPVVEDDDMSEHIATDTPDESLAVEILPRTARGNLDFFDADVLNNAVVERHTFSNGGSTRRALLAETPPMVAEALPLPGDVRSPGERRQKQQPLVQGEGNRRKSQGF